MVEKNEFLDVSFTSPAKEEVAVVIVGDANYTRYGLFLAQQLKHYEVGRDFDICVLSTEPVEIPDDLAHGVRVGSVSVAKTFEKYLRTDERIGLESYLRLFLPGLLSEYGRILYLDADVYQRKAGVASLFELDMKGSPIAAVRDPNYWGVLEHRRAQRRYLKRIGQSRDSYFNAGVLLIDVAAFRRAFVGRNFLEEISASRKMLKMHDQSFFNHIVGDTVTHMHPMWNFPMSIEFAKVFELVDPVLLHFAGAGKPWLETENEDKRKYFEEYRAFLNQNFGVTEFRRAKYDRLDPRSERKYRNPLRELVSKWLDRRRRKSADERVETVVTTLLKDYE